MFQFLLGRYRYDQYIKGCLQKNYNYKKENLLANVLINVVFQGKDIKQGMVNGNLVLVVDLKVSDDFILVDREVFKVIV